MAVLTQESIPPLRSTTALRELLINFPQTQHLRATAQPSLHAFSGWVPDKFVHLQSQSHPQAIG
jgi:hypothetical protein